MNSSEGFATASKTAWLASFVAIPGSLISAITPNIRPSSQQQSANAEQQKEIQALTEALKAQAVQIQKVSEQFAAQVPAPRVVADN